jgi:hypothetical protein
MCNKLFFKFRHSINIQVGYYNVGVMLIRASLDQSRVLKTKF